MPCNLFSDYLQLGSLYTTVQVETVRPEPKNVGILRARKRLANKSTEKNISFLRNYRLPDNCSTQRTFCFWSDRVYIVLGWCPLVRKGRSPSGFLQ